MIDAASYWRRTTCEANNCISKKREGSAYCRLHGERMRYWGHPDGRALSKGQIEPFSQLVQSILNRKENHTYKDGAINKMTALFDWAIRNRDSFSKTKDEMLRLVDAGVSSEELLYVVGGVILYHYRYAPHHDDSRMTMQIGYHVQRLAPYDKSSNRAQNKNKYRYSKPLARPRHEIGQWMRQQFGMLFLFTHRLTEQEASNGLTRQAILADNKSIWAEDSRRVSLKELMENNNQEKTNNDGQ